MTANKKIAVFILSNGRPDNVITYRTLRSHGYTGKIFIIVDDEDQTIGGYKKRFKDEVIVFSKKAYQDKFDIMDNFDGNKVIVYARNACYDIARELDLDYFFEYEDDYTAFRYRWAKGATLKSRSANRLDDILDAMIVCLEETNSSTIAFAQGGEMMGGIKDLYQKQCKRKAMNSFVFKVNEDSADDIIFTGRMNDDVNTYLSLGKVGKLFFQISPINLTQVQTQANSGGNTEAYKAYGTYVKSFYSVMAEPSCCKIAYMGTSHRRMHHRINWNYAVPLILDEKHRKQRAA